MTHTCDFRLPGCFEEADYVAALGAGGDRFACGPCMNASDEPDAFIPLDDLANDDWEPEYSEWRHGGWYVHGVRYPNGAVGCVSRNFADKKWRIVCDDRPGDHTYPTRDAAARAERIIASKAKA